MHVKSTEWSCLSYSLLSWKEPMFTPSYKRYTGHPPVSPIYIHAHPSKGILSDTAMDEKQERGKCLLRRTSHYLYLFPEKRGGGKSLTFDTCCLAPLGSCATEHISHTFQPLRRGGRGMISRLVSHPASEAPALMAITLGSFDGHRCNPR